jgi:outer membrane protein assembly factor BamB
MKKLRFSTKLTFVFGLAIALSASAAQASDYAQEAKQILDATGVKGGLIVHLGCGDGKLTAALQASQSYLVHGLDTDADNVQRARQYIQSIGRYGNVAVDRFDGRRLPYIDNLVDLVIAEDLGQISMDEVMRVLAPGGVAYIKENGQWKKTVKPRPKQIDQWTQYLHDAGNNAVAHDTVVGPPRHMQWLGKPLWTRNHHKLCSISSVVTANSRIFCIADEASPANINLPGKWSILARDAFSGVLLWRKPMASWAWHEIRFRSGPPQVTRLLVACGDRLYAPLGLNAPISVMDAATGKTLQTFDNTKAAEEMVLVDGTLLVLKASDVAEQAEQDKAFAQRFRMPNQKAIVAIEAGTGRTLWKWSDSQLNLMPETLASDGKRVYIQAGEGVVCLDLASGGIVWTAGECQGGRPRRKVTYGQYTLVVADGVVLCNLSGRLTAFSAQNGHKLWDCQAGGGFHSPLDVFVINGLVWQGSHVRDSVAPPPINDFTEGRDVHTGQVMRTNTIEVDLQTAGHHHRCYREKATDRYIITGKRGVEMMDLTGNDHSRNNWVRGACQYGIVPANGLIYAPPHACGCYMEAKLRGFWALSANRMEPPKVPQSQRLEKGPAYGEPTTGQPQDEKSWPQYRHDALRSGVAETLVPSRLAPVWKVHVAGGLTPQVVADGKVLLSAKDEDAVYALNASDGKVIWRYVVGADVDSPPAIDHGMALFGSADGYVYCLRLSDGKLIWRFLAAPVDLRAVAESRVESVWPVHGSVLVLNGIAYCSAGRSTWLDGGIDLYGLDPATGKVIYSDHYQSRSPKIGHGKAQAGPQYDTKISQNTTDYKTFLQSDHSDSFSMAEGTVSDVLTSNGWDVFIHHIRFNARLQKQDKMMRHLFSTSSLLDDAENHRSDWVMGTGDFSRVPVAYSWIVNRPGARSPTIAVPTGITMVYDDRAVWGVKRKGDANGRYTLFMKQNTPFSETENSLPDFRKIPRDQVDACVWSHDFPVRTRAMLKSGPNLFLAVTPVEIPPDDPYAAYEGRRGAMIWTIAADDGSTVAEYKLSSPAVWDGLAAAYGRLYIATADGDVICMAGQ